jgi:hypothetical protein
MLAGLDPFLWLRAIDGAGEELAVDWVAGELSGRPRTHVRTSPLLGWVEWCDTAAEGDWRATTPLDWTAPEPVARGVGAIAGRQAPVPLRDEPMAPYERGRLHERRASIFFPGTELDDPVAQMMTTDLAPPDGEPADGTWERYDLGRIRSGTVRLTVDGQPGALVTIAMAERLFDGRVIPVLTPGRTCVVSCFTLRGGPQEIEPLSIQGGRYVEVRIADRSERTRVVEAVFAERDGLGEPAGRFSCGDERLDRVWSVGIETARAAASDAMIDSIRERAQWTGDTLTVGLELGGVGWHDLALFRQAIYHAAECANADGLVAGCSPGDVIYLSTFSCYWVSAVLRYVELSGDASVLGELLPAARASVGSLHRRLTDDGRFPGAPWPFVDWGHRPPEDAADPAFLAIVLVAARDLARWEAFLGEPDADSRALAGRLESLVRALLPREAGTSSWRELGFHATVWALRCGLVAGGQREDALRSLEEHFLRCFPNDPHGTRLRDATVRDPDVITPFFGHFSLDVLLNAGRVDFVLDQWRTCWGWMLDRGARTWLEVFDEGWSHCHFWSGCPTWQMSRYLLGLWPRGDRGLGEADLRLTPGSLDHAAGAVPFHGGVAEIAWERDGDGIAWRVKPSRPLVLTHAGERHEVAPGETLALVLAPPSR